METVAGIFQSRAQAEEAVRQIHSSGVPNDRIALLTPGMNERDLEAVVPTADSEQPGMGSAMGGTVGGAMGIAGGATLGAAAASVLVPGVGPVIAGGILGAAILGAGGTAAGVAAGQALEEGLESGLPHDELYLYEDALRQGRSVVIAFVADEAAEHAAQKILVAAGAEGIDDARENWWIGLRDAEEAEYQAGGRTFSTDEPSYRSGFEAAMKSRSWWAEQKEAAAAVPAGDHDYAYRCGYERGIKHCKTLREKRNA
jgi:hypothetical protein